ncbi:Prostacyclin synthase [Lachnellula arida]|uniref:Prostacyclin synthase n=1 Tax=Lachnellula arida TaxID=1316785 RepID=A0A8T9BJA0_9HELO|nr:Prostacyclin synthase [Lachnellula arida]
MSLAAIVDFFYQNSAVCLGAGAISLLVVWRIWKFSIIPFLYPNDPKELPCWIPFLGHSVGFFVNSYKLLDQGSQYFGYTREPYALTIAGQSIYVLTHPDDVRDLYRATTTLSWDGFVIDIYRWIGISSSAMEVLWKCPTEEQKSKNPARNLPPNDMVVEYQRRQLRPGTHLDQMAKLFIENIDRAVSWSNISGNRQFVCSSSPDSVTVSLMDWTAHVFINTVHKLYWGDKLMEFTPSVFDSFRKWEETNWKYVFQLPHFLSKDMHEAKNNLIDAFEAYFLQPKEERQNVAWFVSMAESETRDIGLSERDMAKMHMLQQWGINGNMHKVTFWMIAYLVHNPDLYQTIRTETAAGIIDNAPNIPFLTEKCPRLEAVFLEVLRLTIASSLMRYVNAPTVIGGKTLRRGRNVMAPYRQLHLNADVWGHNVHDFDPERFLKNPSLAKHPSFRPFGGGHNLCPGRFLARQAIFAFVALLISRFDVSLADVGAGPQPFPRHDESKPAIGTLAPRREDKVFLDISPRIKKD